MSKSNIKKAEELATESQFLSDFPHDKASVYYGALKMAEWKDERAKLCFIMIAKLIKDGVLTKDCPEHIMVQQMIELYKDVENVMEG